MRKVKNFKSKGNGITIDEWFDYASPESLSLYMFQNPKRAKKLYSDVVPKAVDEYLSLIEKFLGKKLKTNYPTLFGIYTMEVLQMKNCNVVFNASESSRLK